jgi:RimJ/RimL family protein N-acetyltransferase
MDDIRLTPFTLDDWEDFRAIRLEALNAHPNYFLWKYEECVDQPKSFWLERLSYPRQEISGLYDGNTVIGLTGVFTHRDYPDGKTADFGMSYIRPAYRGEKLSRLFYEARIAWARANDFDRIIVSHHAENIRSKNAMLRFGFVPIGSHERTWPDGSVAMDVEYELKL